MEKSSFDPYYYLYSPGNQPESLVDLLLTFAIPIVLTIAVTFITLRFFNKNDWIGKWLNK